jgi:hypothetical protein
VIRGTLVATLLLVSPISLVAQQQILTSGVPVRPVEMQRPPSEKSPTLAALLSWLVWPGVGSYYAGNSGHGTRHVVISAVAVGTAIPLLVTCDNDGFCDFDNDTARLSTVVGLAAVHVANEVWSIITAVNDAEDRNYSIRSGPVSFAPSITKLAVRLPDGRFTSRLGLGVVSFSF